MSNFTITIVSFYQSITNVPIRTVKNAYNDALEAQKGWTSGGSDGGDPELHTPEERKGKLLK